MKSVPIILALLLNLLNHNYVHSQQVLTRGDVYDFQPGDKFQMYLENICGEFAYYIEEIEILTRQNSVSNDSVTYTRVLSEYAPFGFTPYRVRQDTITYTLLDSVPYNNPHQIVDVNTITTDSCGSLRWDMISHDSLTPTLTFDSLHQFFVAGAGGPYYHYERVQGSFGCQLHYQLIYYKKGIVECGSSMISVTGVSTPSENHFNAQVYPNPSTGNFTLLASPEISHYEIVDMNGNIVKTGDIMSEKINIAIETTGVYTLVLHDSQGVSSTRKIVVLE